MSDSREEQEEQEEQLLALARSDDAGKLQRCIEAAGYGAWWLRAELGHENKTLLEVALEADGGVRDSRVASLLLRLPPPRADDGPWPESAENNACLCYELRRPGCQQLLLKVFAELRSSEEFSDSLDALVRAAAETETPEFMRSCLRVACADSWLRRLSGCDGLGRNALHHAALAGNIANVAFLCGELHDCPGVLQHRDSQGRQFFASLLESHSAALLNEALHEGSQLPQALPVEAVDPPELDFLLDEAEAKAELLQLLPASLLNSSEETLVRATCHIGSCRLLLALLSVRLLRSSDFHDVSILTLVEEGKLELAAQLLLLRQRDIAEQAAAVHACCQRLLQEGVGSQQQLADMQQLAGSVCLNSIDAVYESCQRKEQQELQHRHLLRGGQRRSFLTLAGNVEGVFATRCMAELVERRWRFGDAYAGRGPSGVSPRLRFRLHTAAFFVFFALLAVYVLLLARPGWNWSDWIVSVYCVSYGFQELYELTQTRRHYFTAWNLLDIVPVVFLGVAMLMKLVLAAMGTSEHSSEFYSCRVLLAFAFMLSGFKVLSLMRAASSFGPFISMLKALFVRDLVPFLLTVYLALIVCSGVFFHTLLHPSSTEYSSDGVLASPGNASATSKYWDIYLRPLLLSAGEYQLDMHQACLEASAEAGTACPHRTGNAVYMRGIMHAYLIVVNLLLMNLLIARFSLTVANKDERSHHIWRRYRYSLLLEYSSVNTVPPPVNLPFIVGLWAYQLARSACGCVQGAEAASPAEEGAATLQRMQPLSQASAEHHDCFKEEEEDEEEQRFQLLQALALRGRRRQLRRLRCDEASAIDRLDCRIQNYVNEPAT